MRLFYNIDLYLYMFWCALSGDNMFWCALSVDVMDQWITVVRRLDREI